MWRCWTLSLLRFNHERMQLVYEVISLNKILRNHFLSKNMQWNSMLPLIILCKRSWNFAWHFFGIRKLRAKILSNAYLAISQTIHTVCCKDDYFPKGKFKLYNSLCHSVYLVFPKSLFSIADLFAMRYLWVVCNENKCCVVTQSAADIRVAWLVYVRRHCVSIATLNQNKLTRLRYLGHAQIITVCT